MRHACPVTSPRGIAIAVFQDVQTLDATGPAEVFATASRLARESGRRGYRIELASLDGLPVRSSSGIQLGAACRLDELGELDTLIVPGGHGIHAASRDPAFLTALRRAAGRTRRVTSVCT